MNKIITTVAATGLAATFSLAAVAPASADQAAAPRNEIIGGLALVVGIAAIANANNQPQYPYAYGYQAYPEGGYRSGWSPRPDDRNGYDRGRTDDRNGRHDDRGDRGDRR